MGCCWGVRGICWVGVLSGLGALQSSGQTSGTLTGVVTDPSGARVPRVTVHVTAPDKSEQVLTTDGTGRFVVSLPAGSYTVTLIGDGFAASSRDGVEIEAAGKVELKFRLAIPAHAEKVDVLADGRSSTGGSDNRNALVFDEERLADLSDDNGTMQQQLLAMAGGNPMQTPDVYVDGFSGGRFPPKSSIRQVRINQNPYTAEYPSFGMNRMEIFTKPGSDTFHGGVESNGNDAAFNANNPYAMIEPPYYSYYLDGHVSGPLGKKTSFFAGTYFHDLQNNAVVDAIDPVSLGPLSQAVPQPNPSHEYSLRLDRQMAEKNTLTARYEYNLDRQKNAGVGQLVLASEGSDSTSLSQVLRLGDTQIVSPKIVNETRFQYERTRMLQTAESSAATVVVEGSFNGGGSPGGTSHDHHDRFGFENFLSIDRGKHFLRTGGRFELLRVSNDSTANYNGTFTYTTAAAYQAHTPSQFSITTGQPGAVILTARLGVYLEDEWKASKNLTLDLGLRFESQSAIPDHADWAPRLGFAWAVGQHDKKPAFAVIRGGIGIFYDRFAAANLLTAVRENGVSQQSYFVASPSICPADPYTLCPGQLIPSLATTYSVSAAYRSPYSIWGGATAEHAFGKIADVSVSYQLENGEHQLLSRNINAPLPGTFVYGVPGSGTYPLDKTSAVYQFASDGVLRSHGMYVNGNLHPGKRLWMWVYYLVEKNDSDSGGATSFPSNQYDPRADYGRSPNDARQRLYAGGNVSLPWKFTSNFFLGSGTSSPFNITTGTDLNGDTIYNDRPAFATDLTRPSVVKTAYGTFDTLPMPGQTIIPFDYGHGPGYVSLQLSLGKAVEFGPRKQTPAANGKPAGKGDAPYALRFSVEAQNVLNHVNPGGPVGVLNSPLFGKSIGLNNIFSNNPSANRLVMLATSFEF